MSLHLYSGGTAMSSLRHYALRSLLVVSVWGVISATTFAQDKANPNGTWKWSFTTANGETFEMSVKLKLDGEKLTGMFVGRDGRETPIEEAKYKDGDVAFQVTRERDGNKFTVKYHGKVTGDSIKGSAELNIGGEDRSFDWNPTRVAEKPNFAGTWKWSFTRQNGQTVESTLKLSQQADKLTGTYVGRGGNETPVEEIKVKADEITFQITRERDGQKFVVKYQGKLAGDTITGKTESEFNGQTRTRDWQAKRSPGTN
jgi:hypothetical protein